MNADTTPRKGGPASAQATPPDVPSSGGEAPLDFADIQAILLSGYGHLPHAAYLFLRLPRAEGTGQITPDARAALVATLPEVTAANLQKDAAKREKTALNLAFTYDGLAALGHSPETLATFPPEFRSGMTADYRSRALGDVQANDPKNWEWGGTQDDGAGGTMPDPEKAPDLALLCFAHTADGLKALVSGLKERFGACGVQVIADERSTPDMHNRQEHFGFRDNITSVHIEGGFGVKDPGQSIVKAGEFLLGYPNEYGQKTAWPRLNSTGGSDGVDVGTNGAYLVFRKLEQDVPQFWDYCRAQAQSLPTTGGAALTPEFLGAKMVGRWRSGAPLALCPFEDDPELAKNPNKVNDFAYAAEDPHGFRCPMGAHIRRANPRDVLSTLDPEGARTVVNHHRILRRGRPYGPPFSDPTTAADDGRKRGLLFFCVNASISRQFEFVQQTWLNDPKFARRWNEPDPITGSQDNIDAAAQTTAGAEFTIPQPTTRIRLQNVPQFVTVRAGAYLFLPGIMALRRLTTGEPQ
jgi:Dyp-type peroxidase family